MVDTGAYRHDFLLRSSWGLVGRRSSLSQLRSVANGNFGGNCGDLRAESLAFKQDFPTVI